MANPLPIVIGIFVLYAFTRNRGSSTAPQSTEVKRYRVTWPIDQALITRVGDSVTEHRPGSGERHSGLDIFAPSRTVVRSVSAGKVVRVVDGRVSDKKTSKDAGLWVDIKGDDSLIYRYLHLGVAYVSERSPVTQGMPIGHIAEANTSGLGEKPHLHFEIREGDFTQLRQQYGTAIDPLKMLPALQGKG